MNIEFDELLYKLDVSEVKQYYVPREDVPHESVLCFDPSPEQKIQLAYMIWQVATRNRSIYSTSTSKLTPMFEVAESIFSATLENLKSLLLPFAAGNRDLTGKLCYMLFKEYQPAFEKHIQNWEIIHRPDSIWIDEKSNGVFLAPYGDRAAVGLNPTDYVFIYK